jgi:hypothetical protein
VQRQRLGDSRLDAGRERVADGAECLVNAARQSAHASGCTEGNESDDESVLDQILTFFTVLQFLELQVEFEK